MRDLITLVEAMTIKSAQSSDGEINRKKSERILDPKGYFKKAKAPFLEEEELDEREPTQRSIVTRYVVETFNKATGAVISTRDCEQDSDLAWETAKSFKRGAGNGPTGVRIVNYVTTSVTEKKVRNF